MPECVAAVAMLVKDEAFADSRPGEEVDCVAMGYGLGRAGEGVRNLGRV